MPPSRMLCPEAAAEPSDIRMSESTTAKEPSVPSLLESLGTTDCGRDVQPFSQPVKSSSTYRILYDMVGSQVAN